MDIKKKLQDEIDALNYELHNKLPMEIRRAREHGDLSENAEYHGARETQGMLMAKISQLKTRLAGCYIVEKADMPKGIVTFGSTVTVRDLGLDDEETYEFVGPGEEDYDGDIMKILTTSPIAKALAGKKVGDRADVVLPNGKTLKLEITKIVDHGE